MECEVWSGELGRDELGDIREGKTLKVVEKIRRSASLNGIVVKFLKMEEYCVIAWKIT